MNKRQRRLTNEGFSLIELIVVIAIMAILVGVMAPQVMKYINKARINSDKQQADVIKTAVTTALIDDTVTAPTFSGTPKQCSVTINSTTVPSADTDFWDEVAKILGYTSCADLNKILVDKKIKSGTPTAVAITITDNNGTYSVAVSLTGTVDEAGNTIEAK